MKTLKKLIIRLIFVKLVHMKTFEEVQAFLNDIPGINFGGCGLAALSMYRWLKKHTGEEASIVYLYINDDHYINNQNVLRGIDGKIAVPRHIRLLMGTNYMDTTGAVKLSDYKFVHHVDSIDFLIKTLNNPEINGWNNTFRRDKYIKKISKSLKIDLSDII